MFQLALKLQFSRQEERLRDDIGRPVTKTNRHFQPSTLRSDNCRFEILYSMDLLAEHFWHASCTLWRTRKRP
jgi:hypothetical protein